MDMCVAAQVRDAANAVGHGEADWTALLGAWRQAAGADCATFLAWDKRAGALWGHAAVDLPVPAALSAYVERFQSLDPLLPLGLRRPSGAWLDSAELPTAVWRAGPYYPDLMRPLRIEHTYTLTLCNDPRHIAAVSLHFDREISAAQLARHIGSLGPTLMAAFRARLQHAETETLKLDAVLSSEGEGWALIDATLRVGHACAAATHLLSGDAALRLHDSRLHARDEGLAKRLATIAAQALAAGMPRRLDCSAGWGKVLRLWLQPAPRHLLALDEAMLLLRVQLLEAARLPEIDALRALYGLSPAEARLVRELVACHTLDDCALLFDVSRNTLRNQMASIFAKMGCSRQAEVVRMAGLLS